ncbi:MAG TPA: DinB family protein [Thermoanaerobaculia bacterium]|nr:DinB family protein [Thermoanaerobaculia bacterium]
MNEGVAELTGYIDRIRERTMRVVACIPPDKVEWTYREGKFTFGDLMRHLGAVERWMFAENAQRKPSRYPGHGRELADGYEAAVEYMKRMHEESMAIFRGLTDADLEAKCMTPGRMELRVGKWLRSMIEHEIHHRGQIYLYLGMLDIPTPPLYGLTEEEVKARSGGQP